MFDKEAMEYIAAQIKCKGDNILIVSIYRSPNSGAVNNEKMLELLQ